MFNHDSLGTGAFSNFPAPYCLFNMPRTLAGPLPPVAATLRGAHPPLVAATEALSVT